MTEALRWLFQDRSSGRIVVAQTPNVALWIVLAALLLSVIIPQERAHTVVEIVLFLALAYWSIDEVARGVNPWRRMLGGTTFLGILVWLVLVRR